MIQAKTLTPEIVAGISDLTELKKLYNQLQELVEEYDAGQNAVKINLNSGYGVMANPYFTWYDTRMAEAITLCGQAILRWSELQLNLWLNSLFKTKNVDYVIYQDTDSVYLKFENIAKKMEEKGVTDPNKITDAISSFTEKVVQPKLDAWFETLRERTNCTKNMIFFKREAIADSAIFIKKKMYLMHVIDNEGVRFSDPDLKIMGLEAVRSSTPAVCRKRIKDTVKMIFTKDEASVVDYIEEFRALWDDLSVEEIAFPRSMNNMTKWIDKSSAPWCDILEPGNLFDEDDLEELEEDEESSARSGTPIQVKAAINFNNVVCSKDLQKKYELIPNSAKIKFVYLKDPNPLRQNVIGFPKYLPEEFELHNYVDRDLQFNNAFLNPIARILKTIGWATEKKTDLESFFG